MRYARLGDGDGFRLRDFVVGSGRESMLLKSDAMKSCSFSTDMTGLYALMDGVTMGGGAALVLALLFPVSALPFFFTEAGGQLGRQIQVF